MSPRHALGCLAILLLPTGPVADDGNPRIDYAGFARQVADRGRAADQPALPGTITGVR